MAFVHWIEFLEFKAMAKSVLGEYDALVVPLQMGQGMKD